MYLKILSANIIHFQQKQFFLSSTPSQQQAITRKLMRHEHSTKTKQSEDMLMETHRYIINLSLNT